MGYLAFLMFFFSKFSFFLSFDLFYPFSYILSTSACISSFDNFGSELIEGKKMYSFSNLLFGPWY